MQRHLLVANCRFQCRTCLNTGFLLHRKPENGHFSYTELQLRLFVCYDIGSINFIKTLHCNQLSSVSTAQAKLITSKLETALKKNMEVTYFPFSGSWSARVDTKEV